MKEKLLRFMYGRYGVDKFSRHLVFLGILIYLISLFARIPLLGIPALFLFGYSYYRIFSRKTTIRYKELCVYERILSKIKGFPKSVKYRFSQWRQYHIYRCPNCKQKIRIPRGKGNIEISCRKCGTAFRKHA